MIPLALFIVGCASTLWSLALLIGIASAAKAGGQVASDILMLGVYLIVSIICFGAVGIMTRLEALKPKD